MASLALADINSALSLMYERDLVNQINMNSVLMNLLPIRQGGGQSLNWTAKFSGKAVGSAYAEGAARSVADADSELRVPANLQWAEYDSSASVTGLAKAVANSNFNPESASTVADLMMAEAIDAAGKLGRGLAQDLYAGDPTVSPAYELAGAAAAIDSSGTFAGISPGTYSEWSSVEDTVPLADLTVAKVRELLITPIYQACGYDPEFFTCTPELYNTLKSLFGDYEENVSSLSLAGGARELSVGLNIFKIDNIPVIRDRDCTADTLYAWNTRYVNIVQLPTHAGAFVDGKTELMQNFSLASSNQRLATKELEGMAAINSGLRPTVDVMGKDGDRNLVNVKVYAQVEWLRRNAFGKLEIT